MAEYILVSTGTLHAAELRPNLDNLQTAWDKRGGASGVLAALRESDTTIADGDIGEAYVDAVLEAKAQEMRAQGHTISIEREEDIVSNTAGWTRTPWSILLLTPEEHRLWASGDFGPSEADEADLDYQSEAAQAGLEAIGRLFETVQANA